MLLIDACRAVGVPARFAGTPLWTNKSGNHSWVEVWDQGWHFTGAAEPAGDQLDQAWFVDRASNAQADQPLHAIYAASFRRTPLRFPLVWDPDIDYVYAVNVTDRYVNRAQKLPEGMARVMFRVLDRPGGQRLAAALKVAEPGGKVVAEGTTKDERFDANDHLTLALSLGTEYDVEIKHGDATVLSKVTAGSHELPHTWYLKENGTENDLGGQQQVDPEASHQAVAALEQYLAAATAESRPALGEQAFAPVPLTRSDADRARALLWQDHVARIRQERAAEMEARQLTQGELKMPFAYEVFGEKPSHGRSMYISLHGGGGAPKHVNDGQWENQKKLYRPAEGVYVVPRAPTDTWDLWHQAHIDWFFNRLIENLVVFEDVDPNRVYVLGYSAGGDGVYQLAPRLADRWAAASMMAGHPNETSPLGLRNVPFSIHVGENDSAYNRNQVARAWEQQLGELRRNDPDGYIYDVKLYPGKGHWLDREDAAAIPWMAQFARNPFPPRIVWKQDDVPRLRFYWLAVGQGDFRGRAEVTAQRDGQIFHIQAKDVDRLTIRLSDEFVDLDQPVSVMSADRELFRGRVPRTIGVLAKTLAEHGDPQSVFSGEISVTW